MRHVAQGQVVAAIAIAAGLTAGAAGPQIAQASYVEKVDGDWAWVRVTTKGANGPLVRVARKDVAQDRERHGDSLVGQRIETDSKGRLWVYVHPTLKGSVGAGWVRKPLRYNTK